jgi:hypothetical protein
MSDIRQQYRRLDVWMRNLSRIRYAVLVGSTSALAVLVLGTIVSDSVTFEAIAMGLSMTAVYFAWNPTQNH